MEELKDYWGLMLAAIGAWLGALLPPVAIVPLTLMGAGAYWGVTVRIREAGDAE